MNENKEELLKDGTLMIWIEQDITKVNRVIVQQVGTHWCGVFYPDEEE